jgi:hypothetical protein
MPFDLKTAKAMSPSNPSSVLAIADVIDWTFRRRREGLALLTRRFEAAHYACGSRATRVSGGPRTPGHENDFKFPIGEEAML